jgi:hypothetical protein
VALRSFKFEIAEMVFGVHHANPCITRTDTVTPMSILSVPATPATLLSTTTIMERSIPLLNLSFPGILHDAMITSSLGTDSPVCFSGGAASMTFKQLFTLSSMCSAALSCPQPSQTGCPYICGLNLDVRSRTRQHYTNLNSCKATPAAMRALRDTCSR